MTQIYDCGDETRRTEGLEAARAELAEGRLVVVPTDTVYGVAADAFSPVGVEQIFEAKGRGRDMPPPVLIPSTRTVDGLAMAMPSYAKRLIAQFWPGALTIIVRAQQSLAWDLGDSNGTVALRMPDDEIALALLEETGPLAVSSANRTGKAPAETVTEAGFMLGHHVEVYLDGGPRSGGEPSTIIDCTKPDPVLLRQGAIAAERIQEVLGEGVELVRPGDEFGSDIADDEDSVGPVGDEEPQPSELAAMQEGPGADGGHDSSLGEHWEAESGSVTPVEEDAAADGNRNWAYGQDAPEEADRAARHYARSDATPQTPPESDESLDDVDGTDAPPPADEKERP